MEVTEDLVRRIPPANLRVPIAHFAAVWAAAERLDRQAGELRVLAWYPAGVAATCRWLAGVIVDDQFGRRPAESPVTNRSARAFEELIEAEYLAAELLPVSRPDLVEHQPGWCEAIRATLRWAWRGAGLPPLAPDADVASVVPAPRDARETGPARSAGLSAGTAADHGYSVPRS